MYNARELWDSERETRVEQRDISFTNIFPLIAVSCFLLCLSCPPFCNPCIQDSRNNLLDCHIRHAGTVRTHSVQGDLFYCRLGLACEGRSFFVASMWKYDLERSNESNANSTKQSIVSSIKNFLLAIENCICMKSYPRSDLSSILFSYESNESSWS